MERHSASPPCGNLVDGLPRDCHTEPRWIGPSLDPRRSVIFVDIFMFLVIFHIRSYWFVTFRSFISYWSLILCDYQLPCSIKPLFWTSPSLFQNVEKWWNFQKIWTFQIPKAKPFLFKNFQNFENSKISFFENIYVFECFFMYLNHF